MREGERRLEGKPWRPTFYMRASRHRAPAVDSLIGLARLVWSSSPTCFSHPLDVARQNLQPDLQRGIVGREQNKPSPPASDSLGLISAPFSPTSPQIDPKVAFPRRAQPKVSCTEGVNVDGGVLVMSPCRSSSLRPLIGSPLPETESDGGDQRQSTCPS